MINNDNINSEKKSENENKLKEINIQDKSIYNNKLFSLPKIKILFNQIMEKIQSQKKKKTNIAESLKDVRNLMHSALNNVRDDFSKTYKDVVDKKGEELENK